MKKPDNQTRQNPGASKGSVWILTINNPTDDDRDRLTNVNNWPGSVRRVCFQDEIGEETGTLHIQGYIQLTKQQRRRYITRWLPRSAVFVAINRFAVLNYSHKVETGVPGTQIDISRNPEDCVSVSPSSSDSVSAAESDQPMRTISAAKLPKYLAATFKRIQHEEADRYTSLDPRAACELSLRHAVAAGIDCLHIATPSLMKNIEKHWYILLGGVPETTAEWYEIDAARNGIDTT